MSEKADKQITSAGHTPDQEKSLLFLRQLLEEKTSLSPKQQALLLKIIAEDASLLKHLGR